MKLCGALQRTVFSTLTKTKSVTNQNFERVSVVSLEFVRKFAASKISPKLQSESQVLEVYLEFILILNDNLSHISPENVHTLNSPSLIPFLEKRFPLACRNPNIRFYGPEAGHRRQRLRADRVKLTNFLRLPNPDPRPVLHDSQIRKTLALTLLSSACC